MRQLITSILIFLCPLYVSGQLHSLSDYNEHNALAINPSYAGSQDALSISILDRNSWVGFAGSPKTSSLSVHAPVHNDKLGLGLLIVNDKIGVSKQTDLVGNYAYRMNIGYGKLALGLGAGLTLYRIDWTKLQAQDVGDQLLANNSTVTMPNFSGGVYYSTKKYFIGFSVPMFLSYEFDAEKDKYTMRNDFAQYNYFFTTGCNYEINRDVKFFPSLLVKYHKGDATQVDINTRVIYKDRIWLGASYRSKNILVGMLQYQVNDQLRIAYSYDFMFGNDIPYKYNSYEIMLNYVFNYQVNIPGPRQF